MIVINFHSLPGTYETPFLVTNVKHIVINVRTYSSIYSPSIHPQQKNVNVSFYLRFNIFYSLTQSLILETCQFCNKN